MSTLARWPMPDTFAITVFFIAACAIIGAFIKGRAKDRCLRDFSGYSVTIEKNDGKVIWGELRIENSGLELHYPEPYIDKQENQAETSYILYKNEYPQIKALIRYVADFSPALLKSREKQFKKTCHSRLYSLLGRKIRNFFGTVRDSFLEMTDLFMGRIKSLTPVGGILKA